MNMKTTRVSIAVLVAGLALAAHAQNKPCTPADAKNAAKNVDLVGASGGGHRRDHAQSQSAEGERSH
jgi:hypothetical protein